MNLIFTEKNKSPPQRKGSWFTATDRRHGQKVIGRYPDIKSKLVELVVSMSVKSEELHEVKKCHDDFDSSVPW